MSLQPFEQFQHFETHHCVTGSMRHIYAYNQHPVSEDMLLGLGEGVSFIYWHSKGSDPFLGGRGNPKPSLEQVAGQRTGVTVQIHTTSSSARARKTLLDLLEAGQPVMLMVDMGFLPYFDFDGQEYHFGGHAVVACGYDADSKMVLIADRDAELHPVPLADLEKARGSTFQPFPPKNRLYTFDFSAKRQPTADEMRLAMRHQATLMLNPPISNIGVRGIEKTAQLIQSWPDILAPERLPWVLFNCYIFISPVGGSGGGCFRTMFSRFLHEAAEQLADERLNEVSALFKHIGEQWEAVGACFKMCSESSQPASLLPELIRPLHELADLERDAWSCLDRVLS